LENVDATQRTLTFPAVAFAVGVRCPFDRRSTENAATATYRRFFNEISNCECSQVTNDIIRYTTRALTVRFPDPPNAFDDPFRRSDDPRSVQFVVLGLVFVRPAAGATRRRG
jgi:hypothetical protein